jgi:hypothetical protein
MSEVRTAMNDPRYRTSGRFRDEVAAKLHRSHQAGTVASQASYHDGSKRTLGKDRDYSYGNPKANSGGFIQPPADPILAEAGRVAAPGSFFTETETLAAAMGAPQFDLDPSYREALREKIARSIREGYLTRDLHPTGKGK